MGIAKNKESPDVLKMYDIGFAEYFSTWEITNFHLKQHNPSLPFPELIWIKFHLQIVSWINPVSWMRLFCYWKCTPCYFFYSLWVCKPTLIKMQHIDTILLADKEKNVKKLTMRFWHVSSEWQASSQFQCFVLFELCCTESHALN